MLYEQAKLPWKSICVIAGLALAQIGIGIANISSYSPVMVSEGFQDLITCIRGVTSRNLNFRDYVVQKSIKLTISLVSVGISKAAGKVCSSEFKQLLGSDTTSLCMTIGRQVK